MQYMHNLLVLVQSLSKLVFKFWKQIYYIIINYYLLNTKQKQNYYCIMQYMHNFPVLFQFLSKLVSAMPSLVLLTVTDSHSSIESTLNQCITLYKHWINALPFIKFMIHNNMKLSGGILYNNESVTNSINRITVQTSMNEIVFMRRNF